MNRFKASKFKNAAPKIPKKEFWITEISAGSLLNSCGNFVDASCKLMAFNVDTSGGNSLAVLPLDDCGRKSKTMPLLRAHSGLVSDMNFSPFDDYLLATCSFDCTAKLWRLPEGGITEPHITVDPTVITEQSSRIESVLFHPSANNVLAMFLQKTVKVWDIEKMQETYDLNHKDSVQSMSWKGDGSLMATSSKDKLFRIYDPRKSGEPSVEMAGFDGNKDSSVVWRGGTDQIIGAGSSKSRERLVGVWDIRNASTPLKRIEIDNGSGTLMPFYDEDSDMLVLGGKGDNLLIHFDITDTDPYIQLAFTDRLEEQTKGMGMIPKRAVNVMTCEVMRLLQLSKKCVVPISLCVPRKSYLDFHGDLFPETRSGVPSMTAEEWLSGDNKPMAKESLDPSKRPKSAAKPQAAQTSQPKEPIEPVEPSKPAPAVTQPQEPKPEPVQPKLQPVQPKKETEPAPVTQSKPETSAPKKKGKFFMRTSKVRHVHGKQFHKNTFIENIRNLSISTPGECDGFQANKERVVVPFSGPGGQLAVFELNKPGRLPDTGVAVVQNKSTVMDFALSPFDDGELAVACDDSTVRIWKIPQGGLPETTDQPFCQLTGHHDKLNLLKYHTTAEHLLTTASHDHTVKLWDIQKEQECITLTGHPETLFSMDWKKDGKLLATMCRDKKIRLFDPRAKTEAIQVGEGPEGTRGARICWVGPDNEWLFISGFDKGSGRLLSLYDTRGGITHLNTINIDNSPSTLIPFYDEDTAIVYMTGKGDTKVICYEVAADEPHLFELAHFVPGGAHQAIAFLNKSVVDVKEVEVDRAMRLTKTQIEPIKFTIPRVKLEFFQDDLFPDTTVSWESALSCSDWLSGSNKVQKTISLKPADMQKLSDAPQAGNKAKKFEPQTEVNVKTDTEKKDELLSSMVKRVSGIEEPLPQDLMEGVGEDEWDE